MSIDMHSFFSFFPLPLICKLMQTATSRKKAKKLIATEEVSYQQENEGELQKKKNERSKTAIPTETFIVYNDDDDDDGRGQLSMLQ